MGRPIKLDDDLFMTLQRNAGRDVETAVEDLAAKVSERLSDLARAVDGHDIRIDLQVRVSGHRGDASVHGLGTLACYRDLDHYARVETDAATEADDDREDDR